MQTTRKPEVDVLVIGAGPTGLMLANQLRRHGIDVMLIDRHPGPARETRALGVQARTLEIYSHMGLIDRALKLGKRVEAGNLWAQRRLSARIPVGDIGRGLSPYPFLLILGQDDNEKILGEALSRHGASVDWNTELISLTQEPEQVKAVVKKSDGSTREITAAWVAGCDGVHSAVREISAIPFEGAPYEHVFFVADVKVTGTMIPDELNIYLWRKGFHLFFPMRGVDHWRLVGILPEHLREKEGHSFAEVIPSIRQEAGSQLEFGGCTWYSTYRIHHRKAARFRDRRCFLLGDAAHIHSPVGAQGMNTGLQDSYNLAWKLALVVSGEAHAALLDTFEEERLPVAERLLRTTDAAFAFVVSDSWLASLVRTRILARIVAFAMRFEWIRKLAFLTVSQTGISYRGVGARFNYHLFGLKLDDTRFNLVVVGQAMPESLDMERVRVHAVPGDPAFYLLRPDGHIALKGVRVEVDAVTRYFDRLKRSGNA